MNVCVNINEDETNEDQWRPILLILIWNIISIDEEDDNIEGQLLK